MPSFSKMGVFPAGYFRAVSAWLLRERRDVVSRISYLQAEMTRIGFVKMYYRAIQEGDGVRVTEQRTGFSVTRGSSLARLVQAYIATGGNPFNISGFLYPDETEWLETSPELAGQQRYPGGGIVAPKSVAYNNPVPGGDRTGYEGYEGGWMESARYAPSRMGGRLDRGAWDYETVVRVMHDVRKWANAEVKRLQNMEWQIIKLADLHEQLRRERDETLMEAFAGQLSGLPGMDHDKFDQRRLCQSLIADMYDLLYSGDSGIPYSTASNPDTGYLLFVFPDAPEDELGPMG